MHDSHSSNQTSNSTLALLLEVDSELAATEADLLSQLESVQEKRRSLKTLVNMFATADEVSATPIEPPAPPPPAETNGQLKPVSENSSVASLEISLASTTELVNTVALPNPQPNGSKKKASSPARGNKNTQVKRPTKVARKGSGWQDYMRDEFRLSSLPEAVYSVLQGSSDQVFEIPAIVNAIFVEDLPKELESKVRRQITNILSEGARKNKWYRGKLGQYSISPAAKASSV